MTDPLTAANVATFIPGMADRLDPDDPVDQLLLDRMNAFRTEGSGYLAIQNSRPQTIGYGLVDSPLLQLAWIAEKFEEWTDLPIDRDQLLTTVSLYWFTGSGASAAHTLYEQAHSTDWGAPAAVPQGFAVFGRRRDGAARWSPRRPTRTGPSSSAAGTSRRWRPRPSWPPTCRRSSGRSTDRPPTGLLDELRRSRLRHPLRSTGTQSSSRSRPRVSGSSRAETRLIAATATL